MEPERLFIAATWIALMLVYLLGDVLRIFAGDFTPGVIGGKRLSQVAWLGIAALMLVPIVMILLTLVLPYPAARWCSVVVAIVFFLFNAPGIPTYPGAYDKFLIVVSLGINGLTVWRALSWR